MAQAIKAQELRMQHPEVAFALETLELEHVFEHELFFEGQLRTWDKGAEFIIELSCDYQLLIQPMVRSYGGYPVWGRTVAFTNADTKEVIYRQVLHVHVALRKKTTQVVEAEFELEASSLERVVEKSLSHLKVLSKKRLVALLIENIETTN
jgi:hypothetical protein